ncbi:putative agmatinase 1-like protein 2 [Colletotrichum chlorophyti]|uniref:Putative agmatinase 1-like protein 2 n=1 Tax=Colletotrichum chlorophyti TaxID=708187 RepID=A0A1Q8RZ51_9PEZI|nr:putative agmatinase 1-like protein 2 [Colletotrichum chlorophyti]
MHLSPIALLFFESVLAWKVPHQAFRDSASPHDHQMPLGFVNEEEVDILGASSFAGLRTFANLPFVNCFSDEGTEALKYDIAIFGAPHDTVSRHSHPNPHIHSNAHSTNAHRQLLVAQELDLGPQLFERAVRGKGLENGIYTPVGMHYRRIPRRMSCRNPLQSWATVVDCGDARLTWLDNSVALKRLDKSHALDTYEQQVISGRPAANSSVSSTPRILTLGGDHTTTLSALRSTYQRWGPVSVIHFDSHIGE